MKIERFAGVRWFLLSTGHKALAYRWVDLDHFVFCCPGFGNATYKWGIDLPDVVRDLGPAVPPEVPLELRWKIGERWIVELRNGKRTVAHESQSGGLVPIFIEGWSVDLGGKTNLRYRDGRVYPGRDTEYDIVKVIGRIDVAGARVVLEGEG